METESSNLINEILDKKVVNALSTIISSSDLHEIAESASVIANSFTSGDYTISTSEDEKKLVQSFKRNLSLLIQKTWVEEFDIALKEEVLYKLDQFCAKLDEGKWSESYGIFLKILENVVYLMFGTQSRTPEFSEYALRIDPEFGIFWWYVKSLPATNDWSEEKNKSILSVAMFFLANY